MGELRGEGGTNVAEEERFVGELRGKAEEGIFVLGPATEEVFIFLRRGLPTFLEEFSSFCRERLSRFYHIFKNKKKKHKDVCVTQSVYTKVKRVTNKI